MTAAAAQGDGGRRHKLRLLYEGRSERAHAFRFALLAFDLGTVLFIIGTSFLPRTPVIEAVDFVLGMLLLADFTARALICRRFRDFVSPSSLADVIAIVSFLAPVVGEGFGFLRVLRTLRLLHSYQMLDRLKRDHQFFRTHHAVVLAVAHLVIFLFVMTALVYETQHYSNPQIRNYADALYFTVTALTTTGFGDITLPGTTGRMLSVLIMVFGVSLFLRLIQVIFRPPKVEFECPQCGLYRHEEDAVHCKHCGLLLPIRNAGDV